MSQDKNSSAPETPAPPTQRVRPADPKQMPVAPSLRAPAAAPAPPAKKPAAPVD